MKNNVWILTVALAVFGAGMFGNLWAEVEGPTQAGTAGSVRGEVRATTPPGRVAHPLKSGDKIFMGDKIETGVDGNLQIQLLDQTVFTLGPLSTITVDEFVYDPENAENKASMVKGIFRAVSSKVAQKEPVAMPDVEGDADATSQGSKGSSFSKEQEDELKLAELIGAQRSTGHAQRLPAGRRTDA